MNRADPDLLNFMESMVNKCGLAKGETYVAAEKLGYEPLENCCGVVGQLPLHKDVTFPTAPHTEISKKENVRKLEAYVEEMASADQILSLVNAQKIQGDVVKLWNIVKSQPEISEEQNLKNRIKAFYGGVRSARKVPDNCPQPGPIILCHSFYGLKFQNKEQ
ncbi:hypothetical protein BC827DRAFT_1266349 [Russula dissimulans]|nr:hypothetical protein BC827DRAFT_1266349 [Russula dissimulans]